MDLRVWILAEHESVLTRFEQSIVVAVPQARWTDPAGPGGSSIAFLAFHTTYHADLALNAVLRARPPVLPAWRDALGLGGFAPDAGLAEAEPAALTAALDLDALREYVVAVHEDATGYLSSVELLSLGKEVDGPAGLTAAGVEEAAVPWLHRMWADKPAGWFVQWEAIGHRLNHLGEMVAVRNRLGLSPF